MNLLDRIITRWLGTEDKGPLTHDHCAECDKPLHVNERVELLVGAIDFDDEFGGNTATLVTYCQSHAPEAT